ncbi:MAG TPA: YqgE/AlgH family protein [Niabella sp.]|nr:YqgE/AlgH family protein [Niabella sp.]
MIHLSGKILTSAPLMDDPIFRESVIFIAEHNENGALGFVINKIFERNLNELVEFSSSPAFPLFEGGPVDKDHLYFIHKHNDLIPGGVWVTEDIYYSGDFKQAIAYINNTTLTASDIKIFIGYCGWDKGDLEAEIAEGSWIVNDYREDIIFHESGYRPKAKS